MSRRSTLAAAAAAAAALALAAAAPAGAQNEALPAGTLTVVGSGEAGVTPKDRKSNASIAAAVDAARKQALPLAVGNARGRAVTLASVSGLTLGPLLAVAETSPPIGFAYFPGPYGEGGTFGPGRYCGTVTRSTFTTNAAGVRTRTGTRRTRTCRVPRTVTRAVTMTFAASTPQA